MTVMTFCFYTNIIIPLIQLRLKTKVSRSTHDSSLGQVPFSRDNRTMLCLTQNVNKPGAIENASLNNNNNVIPSSYSLRHIFDS